MKNLIPAMCSVRFSLKTPIMTGILSCRKLKQAALFPKNIIVYGSAPDSIFKPYKGMGINIIALESDFSKSRERVRHKRPEPHAVQKGKFSAIMR